MVGSWFLVATSCVEILLCSASSNAVVSDETSCFLFLFSFFFFFSFYSSYSSFMPASKNENAESLPRARGLIKSSTSQVILAVLQYLENFNLKIIRSRFVLKPTLN